MIRSILAVLGGFVVAAILVSFGVMLAVKLLLPAAAVPDQPPQLNPKYLAANLILGALAATIGGYVTALISGRSPLLHAGVLAAGIFLLSAVSAFQGPQPGQPKWYPFVLIAVGPASALVGGWLRSWS
jgi:uncharacterized YccA/Bax inhibitor family protein